MGGGTGGEEGEGEWWWWCVWCCIGYVFFPGETQGTNTLQRCFYFPTARFFQDPLCSPHHTMENCECERVTCISYLTRRGNARGRLRKSLSAYQKRKYARQESLCARKPPHPHQVPHPGRAAPAPSRRRRSRSTRRQGGPRASCARGGPLRIPLDSTTSPHADRIEPRSGDCEQRMPWTGPSTGT